MRRRHALVVTIGAVAAALAATVPQALAAGGFGFASPTYVDTHLAGGEPGIIASSRFGTLIYTAHEGTTHLYRPGLTGSPGGDADFATNYRNQVNIWISRDAGRNWQQVNWMGTGFESNPAQNTGFSDPDLSLDAAGNVYNTGIDLANDSVFSSTDGGAHWTRGTAQCHDGDRPWLAGGRPNQVFMATDTVEGSGSGHQVFVSNDGGQTCSATGIPDNGPWGNSGGSYSGFGKLYFDHRTGNLVEPAEFMDSSGTVNGVGVSILRPGASAFQPIHVASTSVFAHWPAIAIDSASNLYVVWDTDDRAAGTSGGCGGAATPLPNSIKMAVSHDGGKTWSTSTLAHPGTRVFWPWITAGDAGKVNVVWYQTDKVVDIDCQPAAVSVYSAFVNDRHVSIVNAAGRPVHVGSVCQGGTLCVATGQDRRLGDYFTNALDPNGCVIIATGDTRLMDEDNGQPFPTARPLFIKQNSGPSLIGNHRCA